MSNTSAPIKPNQQIAQNNAPQNIPSPNVDINSIKKQFKNLSLALASKAVGSVKFESGANRNLSTKDNNLDTSIDKENDGFLWTKKMWLSVKNLAVNNFGKKENKDVLALEMTSASIYKTLKTSVDKYLTFFKENGDFDNSKLNEFRVFQKENKNNIDTFIGDLTSGANKTSLSADEIKSCKLILLNLFALDGQNTNLGNIVDKQQKIYDNLNDTQSRQVADHNNLRTQETIGKVIAGGVSKMAAIATAPFTGGVGGAVGFGVLEAGTREVLETRTKGKALEKQVGNLRKAINEEVALLDGVDVQNKTTVELDHPDQENKTPNIDATTGKIKDKGYRGKYKDALDVFRSNPSDPETKKNLIRYAHLFVKSVESIRSYIEDNKEGNLSAATLSSYNKNLRTAQNLVLDLINAGIILNDPSVVASVNAKTFKNFAYIRDALSLMLDSTDKNDKIALETNPVENVRRREAANINKFNAQEKRQIAEGRMGRLGVGTLMCSLGNMFAVVNAGVASMANKIGGTQEVAVTSFEQTRDAIGTKAAEKAVLNGQKIEEYMNLSKHVGGLAQDSFDQTTGLKWFSKSIDSIFGNQNTIGGLFSKTSETVIKFGDWFRQFNPWNDTNVPGFGQNIFVKGAKGAEAVGDAFTNKAGQRVREYAFDGAGAIFKSAAKSMSNLGSAALWGTVGLGALRSRAYYSGKALDVAQGGLPPIFNIPAIEPKEELVPEPLKQVSIPIDDLKQVEDDEEATEEPENFKDFQKPQHILPPAKDKPEPKLLTPAKENYRDFQQPVPQIEAGQDLQDLGKATRIEEKEQITGTPDRLRLNPGEDTSIVTTGPNNLKNVDPNEQTNDDSADQSGAMITPAPNKSTNDQATAPQNLLPSGDRLKTNPDQSVSSDFRTSNDQINGKPDSLALPESEQNTNSPESALAKRINQAARILDKKVTAEALVNPLNPNSIDRSKALALFSAIIKQSPENRLVFDVVNVGLERFAKELTKNPNLSLDQQIAILKMSFMDTLQLKWTGNFDQLKPSTAQLEQSPYKQLKAGLPLLNQVNSVRQTPIQKSQLLGTSYDEFSRSEAAKALKVTFAEFKKKEFNDSFKTDFDAFSRVRDLINNLNNPNQPPIEKLVANKMNDKLKALDIDLAQNKTLSSKQQDRIGRMYVELLNQDQIN